MTTKRKRKDTTRGRQAGGHNRGYWFRKGRGWYATENGKPLPLRAENGDHLKDRCSVRPNCRREKRWANWNSTQLLANMGGVVAWSISERSASRKYRLREERR